MMILTRGICAVAAATLALTLAGCAGQGGSQQAGEGQAAASSAAIADGIYDIEAETDSSMFRSDSCKLVVKDSTYMAVLVLPGEGFTKLYLGSAEDAAKATDKELIAYKTNDEGKFSFEIPVSALEQEIRVAAYGPRKDKWYDHTIVFHAPGTSAQSDAA